MGGPWVSPRRPVSPVGNVDYVGSVHVLEDLAAHLRDPPDARRAEIQLARLLLGQRDQLLERVRGNGGMDGNGTDGHGHAADRLDILERRVGQDLDDVWLDRQHRSQIGRAHVSPPLPNAQLLCRLMLDKPTLTKSYS